MSRTGRGQKVAIQLQLRCRLERSMWGQLLIIQHVSLIPALVVGTCERAWSLCWGANRVLETPIEANLLACL